MKTSGVKPPLAGAQRGWSLDDARPGAVLRHAGGRTIGEAEHVWLAWSTHNVSGIHGNADAASRTEWGEPLVLGMLTAAIVIGLAQPIQGPAESERGGLDGTWRSIKLEHPVMAGDTVRAESRIKAVGALTAGAGRVSRSIIGRNQHDQVVVTIEEELSVPRHLDVTG